MVMKLCRIENKRWGIRYLTYDVRYRIWKPYKKACWELSEIHSHGHKVIKHFKYFRDARQYLKNLLEAEGDNANDNTM